MEQVDVGVYVEVKEVSEDGTFQGIASVVEVEDLGGDIIEKGAFRKTLAENPSVPILNQHDSKEVLGEGQVKEWQNKILVSAQLDMDDPLAVQVHRKLKKRLIKGLSIGFQAIKATYQEIEQNGATKYIRRIQELKLWEISVTPFPMNQLAQVTRVKSLEADARLKALEDKVSALSAAKATPPAEPAKAEEPQSKTPEPAASHSGMIYRANSLSALLRKGESK